MDFQTLTSNNIELIEKELKCASCMNFLSHFPIYICANNENICGRCTLPQENVYYRNNTYEAVAQFLKFPCRYKDQGCFEEEFPKDMPQHEISCSFRTIKCPISESTGCIWEGIHCKSLGHCQEQHCDLILKSGEEFELNLSNNFDDVNLLEYDNSLLCIKKKFDSSVKILQWAVYYLHDKKDTIQYSYQFTVKNNNRKVSIDLFALSFEELSFTEILLESLKAPTENYPEKLCGIIILNNGVNAEKLPELRCMRCSICSELALPPISQCLLKFCTLCSECVNKHIPTCHTCASVYGVTKTLRNQALEEIANCFIYPCRNNKNGCKIKDNVNKINNHQEICLYEEIKCPYKKCLWRFPRKTIMLHVLKFHSHKLIKNSSSADLSLAQNGSYFFLIIFLNILFYVRKRIRKPFLEFSVQAFTNFEDNFLCEIEITDDNGRRLATTLPCSQSTEEIKCLFHMDQIDHFLRDNVLTYKTRIFKK